MFNTYVYHNMHIIPQQTALAFGSQPRYKLRCSFRRKFRGWFRKSFIFGSKLSRAPRQGCNCFRIF